jgi:hypothetical protein
LVIRQTLPLTFNIIREMKLYKLVEVEGFTPIRPQYFTDLETAKYCRDYMNSNEHFNYTRVRIVTFKTKER